MSHHYGEAQSHLDLVEQHIKKPEDYIQLAIAHALLDIACELQEATQAIRDLSETVSHQ